MGVPFVVTINVNDLSKDIYESNIGENINVNTLVNIQGKGKAKAMTKALIDQTLVNPNFFHGQFVNMKHGENTLVRTCYNFVIMFGGNKYCFKFGNS